MRQKVVNNKRVQISGINTQDLPVMSKQEKEALLVKALNGDKEARQQYAFCNLRLVLSVVQTFGNRHDMIDDLFQIGCIGLMKAIDNFQLERGVQFSTYAFPMIAGEIKKFLRDNGPLKVSRTLKDIAYKTLRIREELRTKNYYEPSLDEIAQESEFSKEKILQAMDAIQDPLSLYEPLYYAKSHNSEMFVLVDQVKDEKNLDENWLENLMLIESLDKLTKRDKIVLYMRFFQCKTQHEIASEIGVSQAQISRLEKNALIALSKNIN